MEQEEVLDTLQTLVDDVDYIRRSTDNISSSVDIIIEILGDIENHLSYMASEKR